MTTTIFTAKSVGGESAYPTNPGKGWSDKCKINYVYSPRDELTGVMCSMHYPRIPWIVM